MHSVIDLGRMSPSASCSLPPARMVPENRSGAGSPLPFGLAVYLALQPMRCTADRVATITGGLLPRLFTLIPTQGRDGHSLLHDCELSPAFPLGSMAPFVARTFLPICTGRQNGLLFCKDRCFNPNSGIEGATRMTWKTGTKGMKGTTRTKEIRLD